MENLRTGVQDAGERETFSLIGSDKVEGTRVYAVNGDPIGHIERVMIGKLDGHVAYAVLGFGGFLGIGKDYYPLPWSALTYDATLGGYEVAVTEEQLRGAPRYSDNDEWNWEDRAVASRVDDYWRTYN